MHVVLSLADWRLRKEYISQIILSDGIVRQRSRGPFSADYESFMDFDGLCMANSSSTGLSFAHCCSNLTPRTVGDRRVRKLYRKECFSLCESANVQLQNMFNYD